MLPKSAVTKMPAQIEIFKPNLIKTNVTALRFYANYILAGIAGELYTFQCINGNSYTSWPLVHKTIIFQNQIIHGIVLNEKDKFVIFGGKYLSVISLTPSDEKVLFLIEDTFCCDDWVLDVSWVQDCSELLILTAHNSVHKYSMSEKKIVTSINCEERCILYSGKIAITKKEELVILAGTVFQEIVTWRVDSNSECETKPILQRLRGHKGVIFHVDYDSKTHRICSTSDDRTVRIWSIVNPSNNWEDLIIELKHTIFAHTARVWRSRFLSDERIISIGEDSLICVWDKSGNCERQWSGHQGGAVWSVDCRQDLGVVVTGGADGGISLWPLANISPLTSLPKIITSLGFETPKSLMFSNFGDVWVKTESGVLLVFTNEEWEIRFKDDRFSSYCVQDLSSKRNYIALGSIKGELVILTVDRQNMVKTIDMKVISGKIFSLHWAVDEKLLICGEEGSLLLWELYLSEDKPNFTLLGRFKIPACKERWTTSAIIFGDYLLCGDRCGSVHLYDVTAGCDHFCMPLHSLSKLHGCRGVSCLQIIHEDIFSSGRDGTIRNIEVMENKLCLLSTNKLQMDWVASIKQTNIFGTVAIGFHDINFIIWSIEERRPLLKINCGGGHRSWDCLIDEDHGNLWLGFIKNKEIKYFFNPFSRIYNISPLSGFHTKTINSGCILPDSKIGDVVLLTGSEDTTLRVLRVSGNSLETDIVLRNHLSSIRSVVSLKSSHDGNTYAFSAGGRGQLKVWKLAVKKNGDMLAVELGSHMLMNDFGGRKPWQLAQPRTDPETRYMDLCITDIQHSKILIMSGCSDGFFRLLLFDTVSTSLSIIGSFDFHKHCILKVVHFAIGKVSVCGTMSTDGKIAFWFFDDLMKDCDEVNLTDPSVHKIHSLGINSCDYKLRNGYFILSTGCDDASIGVNVFSIDSKCASHISSWYNKEAHTCQVTGIHMTEEYILTVGLDQRLSLFSWNLLGDSGLLIKFLSQFSCNIPDIHGILVWTNSSDYDVCIYGLGIQTVKMIEEKFR